MMDSARLIDPIGATESQLAPRTRSRVVSPNTGMASLARPLFSFLPLD